MNPTVQAVIENWKEFGGSAGWKLAIRKDKGFFNVEDPFQVGFILPLPPRLPVICIVSQLSIKTAKIVGALRFSYCIGFSGHIEKSKNRNMLQVISHSKGINALLQVVMSSHELSDKKLKVLDVEG